MSSNKKSTSFLYQNSTSIFLLILCLLRTNTVCQNHVVKWGHFANCKVHVDRFAIKNDLSLGGNHGGFACNCGYLHLACFAKKHPFCNDIGKPFADKTKGQTVAYGGVATIIQRLDFVATIQNNLAAMHVWQHPFDVLCVGNNQLYHHNGKQNCKKVAKQRNVALVYYATSKRLPQIEQAHDCTTNQKGVAKGGNHAPKQPFAKANGGNTHQH